MMFPVNWRRIGISVLSLALAALFGCDAGRLRQPVSDFQKATAVVTAQARLSYGQINRVERIRAIQTARLLHHRLDPRALEAETTFLRGEDLAARFDALDHLDQYASLLSSLVNSDAPAKIAASATGLETSLNALAARIQQLQTPAPAAEAPNTSRFQATFGVFAAFAREVLTFLAQRKQAEALRKAVLEGEVPVNELIDAINDDLQLAWYLQRKNMDRDMIAAFQAFNAAVTAEHPDEARLLAAEKALLLNLDAQDLFYAANPSESLAQLKKSNQKLAAYARQDSLGSLAEAVASIQTFVDSATRLGAAVVKLQAVDAPKP